MRKKIKLSKSEDIDLNIKIKLDESTLEELSDESLIFKYDIDPYDYSDEVLMNASIQIFEHYKLFELFHFEKKSFYKFLCQVKSLYNPDNLFHNFKHVWGVLHISFQILLHGADNYLETLDIFAVMISALCHDLQHPGNNNAFEEATHSDLSKIYTFPTTTTSNNNKNNKSTCLSDHPILEQYHVTLTRKLLNNGIKDNDILKGLTCHQKVHFFRQVGLIILGTDMAKHATILAEAKSYTNNYRVTRNNINSTAYHHNTNSTSNNSNNTTPRQQQKKVMKLSSNRNTALSSSSNNNNNIQNILEHTINHNSNVTSSNIIKNNKIEPHHSSSIEHQQEEVSILDIFYDETKPMIQGTISKSDPDSRISFTRLIVHVADLGAQTQCYEVAIKWMNRCFGEFRSQANKEKSLGIMTSAFLHDLTDEVKIYSAQYHFIHDTVEPLWEAMSILLPDLKFALNQLISNKEAYKKILDNQIP